ICQLVATERPERIGRLILTNCDAFENFLPPLFRPLQWLARVPPLLTAAVQPLRLPALHGLPIAFGLLTKRPLPREVTEAWVRPFLSQRGVRRDTAKLLRGIDKRDTLEAAAKLASFDRPALIAWGSDDKAFGTDDGRRLATILPQGRFVEVPDSRTFVSEDQPERLAELIGEFVRSTPIGRASAR
ncbi:MAG: alpha/beta hydrolase, partial [Actinomycetota bacterium]|nr:alpha/beta hydrolase [Actinomycetota bacterium]